MVTAGSSRYRQVSRYYHHVLMQLAVPHPVNEHLLDEIYPTLVSITPVLYRRR